MRAVLKFGGSSVQSIEYMKKVSKVIIEKKKTYDELVVVLSAMGKTTNQLLGMAKEITKYPNKRDVDLLISTGEIVSIALLSIMLNDLGYPSIALTGEKAGILTKGTHTKNKISDIDIRKVESHIKAGNIVIVAGFQGFNKDGEVTTLGRGGSDTTAVALAAKLQAICEIYTDVARSEEHTSELQSRPHLVCRLLLEKKNKIKQVYSKPAFVTEMTSQLFDKAQYLHDNTKHSTSSRDPFHFQVHSPS